MQKMWLYLRYHQLRLHTFHPTGILSDDLRLIVLIDDKHKQGRNAYHIICHIQIRQEYPDTDRQHRAERRKNSQLEQARICLLSHYEQAHSYEQIREKADTRPDPETPAHGKDTVRIDPVQNIRKRCAKQEQQIDKLKNHQRLENNRDEPVLLHLRETDPKCI